MNHISTSTLASASLLAQYDSSLIGKALAVKNLEQRQLETAAKEFEAVMLSMVLKEMRTSLDPSGGLFGGDGSDTYGGMFDMFMGQSLAENQPLGVAEMIQQYSHRQSSAE